MPQFTTDRLPLVTAMLGLPTLGAAANLQRLKPATNDRFRNLPADKVLEADFLLPIRTSLDENKRSKRAIGEPESLRAFRFSAGS